MTYYVNVFVNNKDIPLEKTVLYIKQRLNSKEKFQSKDINDYNNTRLLNMIKSDENYRFYWAGYCREGVYNTYCRIASIIKLFGRYSFSKKPIFVESISGINTLKQRENLAKFMNKYFLSGKCEASPGLSENQSILINNLASAPMVSFILLLMEDYPTLFNNKVPSSREVIDSILKSSSSRFTHQKENQVLTAFYLYTIPKKNKNHRFQHLDWHANGPGSWMLANLIYYQQEWSEFVDLYKGTIKSILADDNNPNSLAIKLVEGVLDYKLKMEAVEW